MSSLQISVKYSAGSVVIQSTGQTIQLATPPKTQVIQLGTLSAAVNQQITQAVSSSAASAASAAASATASANAYSAIANGTATDAGTLTGSETLPMSRTAGLLQTTLSNIATFVLSLFTISLGIAGAVKRTILSKLQERLSPADFKAATDLDDTASITKALAAGLSTGAAIDFGSKTYIVSSTCVVDLGATGKLKLIGSGATLFLANGSIVNTDASPTHYTPIIRIQGGSWIEIDGLYFDGNRDNQTYPATVNTFGRGTKPWRHNGLLEITPSSDNASAPLRVTVRNSLFQNAYLSGLVCWQAKNVLIDKCAFLNNTWNGSCGAGLTNYEFRDCYGLRNGVSSIYTAARQDGDRATLQIREFEAGFTSATEGIPTIPQAANQMNVAIKVHGGYFEEDQVEAIFLRSCTFAEVNGAKCKNIGYQRLSSASYNPAPIWCEEGVFTISNVDCYQPAALTPGWLAPDGIVCYTFVGNGTSTIPMQGAYESTISNVRIFCGQDYVSGADYTANANKKNNFYRGIRHNGHINILNAVIEGCSSYPIYGINDGNFNANEVRKTSIVGGSIRNFLGDGAFFFTKYGSPTGTGGEIIITGTRVEDGRSTTTGIGRAIVLFDTTLDGLAFDDVSITNNNWDCSNSADSTLNYIGVRQRGASTSRSLKITGNTIYNSIRAFRIACGKEVLINGNTINSTSRVFDLSLTGAVDVLSLTGNTATGVTFSVGDFSGIGSFTVSRFVMHGNVWEGSSAGNLLNSYTPGVGQLNCMSAPNLVTGFSAADVRRSGSAAPSTSAFHLGEIYVNTSGPTYYLGVSVGSGASDWKQLT